MAARNPQLNSQEFRSMTMPDRPLLTAQWRNLLLLNFPVPTELIASLAPPGTEPDLHNGQSYISIVGFQFQNVRFLGLPWPGHTNFPEINLRYYVRRTIGNEIRRGVVFVREIVPRRAVSIIANRLYNENYITRPMRSALHIAASELSRGDTIEYAWKSRIPLPRREGPGEGSSARDRRASPARTRWNRLSARVAAPLALPPAGSLEEFIVEHYWGYTHSRDGRTNEYRVAHAPWPVAPADNVAWDCDVAATYDEPFAQYLASPPTSALVADGSAIEVFRGHKLFHHS
jgi:uncharacterized protein YqjF (DUF2071 family)